MWRGMVLMIVLLLLICILFYTSIPGMVVWGGFGGHIHPEFTCNEGVGGGGSREAYFFAHSCCRLSPANALPVLCQLHRQIIPKGEQA